MPTATLLNYLEREKKLSTKANSILEYNILSEKWTEYKINKSVAFGAIVQRDNQILVFGGIKGNEIIGDLICFEFTANNSDHLITPNSKKLKVSEILPFRIPPHVQVVTLEDMPDLWVFKLGYAGFTLFN